MARTVHVMTMGDGIEDPSSPAHGVDEVRRALVESFVDLGWNTIETWRWAGTGPLPFEEGSLKILLNPHLAAHLDLPKDTLLYNLEQYSPESRWFTDSYRDLLRRYRALDYNRRQIRRLEAIGIRATYLPIAYHPSIVFPLAEKPEHDVLFTGALNDRRAKILDEMRQRGVSVRHESRVFGEAKNRLCAASRVVLNIHYYEAQTLEEVRLLPLFASGVPVISEDGDPEAESLYPTVRFVPYDRIVEETVSMVDDSVRYKTLGYGLGAVDSVRSRPLVSFLPDVLRELGEEA
jgi:hypothetical protein